MTLPELLAEASWITPLDVSKLSSMCCSLFRNSLKYWNKWKLIPSWLNQFTRLSIRRAAFPTIIVLSSVARVISTDTHCSSRKRRGPSSCPELELLMETPGREPKYAKPCGAEK